MLRIRVVAALFMACLLLLASSCSTEEVLVADVDIPFAATEISAEANLWWARALVDINGDGNQLGPGESITGDGSYDIIVSKYFRKTILCSCVTLGICFFIFSRSLEAKYNNSF